MVCYPHMSSGPYYHNSLSCVPESYVITQEYLVIDCIIEFHGFTYVHKYVQKKGKGLLNKEESKKEFGSGSSVKYSVCMDPLLEGDKLKPGELNTLTCMKDFEAVTDFTSMTEKEKDGHIYTLFGKLSKYKSEEYMQKWLSFFIIIHKQTLKAKAG